MFSSRIHSSKRSLLQRRNCHITQRCLTTSHVASITQTKHYLQHFNTYYNNNNNNNNKNNNNNYRFKLNDGYTLGLLSLLGMTASVYGNKKLEKWNNVSACGIMGVVGKDEECLEYLLDGLLILQNRGYDSAGIATISDADEIFVTKYASKGSTSDSLDLLKQKAPSSHMDHTIGLAHTRWATHGAKTDNNAHPHCDYKNRLAIVHNGTIQNSEPIKRELQARGIPFKSQTDTEVIVNLVSYYLDQENRETGKNFSIEEALSHALSQMDGSWGIAMISKDRPGEIFAARNGSPLMIGLDREQERNFIASEHTAFARYTNEYIPLEDGEIAVFSNKKISLDVSRVKKVDEESDILIGGTAPDNKVVPFSPAPYPHWTLKEMMEQPAAISRAMAYGARLAFDNQSRLGGLEKQKELLTGIKHLVMTGCGTSYHAGLYAQRLMQYLNSFDTATVVDSAEVIVDTFPTTNSGLLAISQSGETKDVLNALKVAELVSVPRFSVVNAVGSAIARQTGCGVYAYAGREHAVASTKAFLSQATVLALIALWFAQHKSDSSQSSGNANTNSERIIKGTGGHESRVSQENLFDRDVFRNLHNESQNNRDSGRMASVDYQRRDNLVSALHKLPTYCGLTLDNTRKACQKIAQELYDNKVEHMFILGKGYAEPIAYEGALKVKEVSYVHCEGFSGGALKHGPFALIEQGTPVVMIILDDAHKNTMLTNAHEIASRGGKCIYITDNSELIKSSGLDTSHIIKIPRNGVLTALLAVIPLQYIAYELAVLLGHDPDKPKNLAKAVTVD